jgi:hypothetical protein
MPLSIGRIELDASQLWREHPPQIHHAQKRMLFELAGGLDRVPRGKIVATRWAPSDPLLRAGAAARPNPAIESVDGPFTYPREEAGVDAWHVNFADTYLFAFYAGAAFAQDEIQVAEHPILASVRGALLNRAAQDFPALTRDRDRPTPVLVRNVERWCAIDTRPELAEPYGIYGSRLGRASAGALEQAVTRLDDVPLTNILAIVAPQGSGRYTTEQIRDVLVTATTGFAAAREESTAGRVRIHTGHWGTGVFGGNRVLMAAAQIIAARAVGIDALAYYSLGDDAARAFEKGRAVADQLAGAALDDAVTALDARAFTWGSSDGN